MTGFKQNTKRFYVENKQVFANDINAFYGRFEMTMDPLVKQRVNDATNFSFEQEKMTSLVRSFPADDITISVCGVRTLFTRLNSHKAMGLDAMM